MDRQIRSDYQISPSLIIISGEGWKTWSITNVRLWGTNDS